MSPQVLVAGIGNIFFGDDGFGPAVAVEVLSRAGQHPLPDGIRVVDYGVRGMHLAYDLLDGVDALVLIDTVPAALLGVRDDPPGRVAVLEIDAATLGDGTFDAHAMSPVSVLSALAPLGGTLPPTYLVGCVPADLDDGIGLSAPVAAAVGEAAGVVIDLVRRLATGAPVDAAGRVG